MYEDFQYTLCSSEAEVSVSLAFGADSSERSRVWCNDPKVLETIQLAADRRNCAGVTSCLIAC